MNRVSFFTEQNWNMNDPIHVAIIRRVKPGFEAEFQRALREFIQASFSHSSVQGANIIIPPPDSTSREFGILRTFVNAQERDAFHETPMFKAWTERIKPLTEGDPEVRQLSGLEAWFRGPQSPPPKWKMAVLIWVAVWPTSMFVRSLLDPLIGKSVPPVLFGGTVAAGIVVVLTWIAMPLLARLAHNWLKAGSQPATSHSEPPSAQ